MARIMELGWRVFLRWGLKYFGSFDTILVNASSTDSIRTYWGSCCGGDNVVA